MKRFLVLCFLLLQTLGFSQSSSPDRGLAFTSLSVNPALSLPIGGDVRLYTEGGGIRVNGDVRLPLLNIFYMTGGLDYRVVPLKEETSLSLFSVGLGPKINWEVFPRFRLSAFAEGGYFYGFLNNGTGPKGVNPFFIAGSGVSYQLFPSVGIGLSASYLNFLGLYQTVEFSLGAVFYIGAKSRIIETIPPPLITPMDHSIRIEDVELQSIFPVFYSHYDNHSLGSVTLYNDGEASLEEITLSFFVKQFMDNPKEIKVPTLLAPGERVDLELFGLFTDALLNISEGTKVSAGITVEYTAEGIQYSKEQFETLHIHDRNSMTWDDNEKAAAFVTAKDPDVLRVAKYVAGLVKDSEAPQFNFNLQVVSGIHEALSLYGMKYVIDPSTPYIEFSQNSSAIDFLQFPQQTLDFKAGDCDDLSILYSSLLEAIGIETAFITIPQHIYLAVSLDMKPEQASKLFSRPEDLIFKDDKVWLPFEVTELDGGFNRAWQTGARQWQEYFPQNKAGFYPVRDAWKNYEPTGWSSNSASIDLEDKRDQIAEGYLEEWNQFLEKELSPRELELKAKIEEKQDDPKLLNRLGLLYARFGLLERAEKEFERVIRAVEYIPSLVNLGNLNYLLENLDKALVFYGRAQEGAPENDVVILSLAITNHALGNFEEAANFYIRLKTLNSDLATQYAYLDYDVNEPNLRAGRAESEPGDMLWQEE